MNTSFWKTPTPASDWKFVSSDPSVLCGFVLRCEIKRIMNFRQLAATSALILSVFSNSLAADSKAGEVGFKPLFPKDGTPEGWAVRDWADVKNPGPEGAAWKVIDGVLHGS